MTPLLLLLLLVVATPTTFADGDASANAGASSSSSSGTPPIVPPPPPPPAGGFPGGLPGGIAGLFPGLLGGGFNKHLDISAGGGFGGLPWGLLGGGLPGGVGVPPPPIEGLGGFPGGFLGPSYIPSSWLGSALGAKGDLLFPLVIFVFFVVGVWTIVQFLLGLIVPLIAAKVSVLKGDNRKWRRSLTPQEEKEEQINHLTNVVMAAFENFGCMKTSACFVGNMVHSIDSKAAVDKYEGLLSTMKIMDKDIVAIFKKAVQSGKEDCSLYPCQSGAFDGVDNNRVD